MYIWKKALALLAAAMLLPVCSAGSETIPPGRWVRLSDSNTVNLLLGSGGAYIAKSEDASAIALETGTYRCGGGKLTLQPEGGNATTLEYQYLPGSLSVREGTGSWTQLKREPWLVPAGLADTWLGKDSRGGPFAFIFREDGAFEMEYEGGGKVGSGIYLADWTGILIAFDDGTRMEMRYSLSGDTLELTDRSDGHLFTAGRRLRMALQASATPGVQAEETPSPLDTTPAHSPVPAVAYSDEDDGISLEVPGSITVNDANDDGTVYLCPYGEGIPYVMVKRYEPAPLTEFITAHALQMRESYKDRGFAEGERFSGEAGGRPVEGITFKYSVEGYTILDTRVFFMENGWIYMFARKEIPDLDEYVTDLFDGAVRSFKAVGKAYRAAVETPAPAADTPAPAAETPAPAAPGITGTWRGTDEAGTRVMTLGMDGTITIAYAEAAAGGQSRKGVYTADGSTILALFEDGSMASYRYMAMGNVMLLTDTSLSNPVTMVRAD